MHADDTLFGQVKNGVLVLSGFQNASVTVKGGSLCVRDGVKGNMTERLYSRARCPVSRLISTQWGGFISFDAIRWLWGVGASFVHLGYDGTPLMVSVPQHAIAAAMRRKQALLSIDSEPGSSIVRVLLGAKFKGQLNVLLHCGLCEEVEAIYLPVLPKQNESHSVPARIAATSAEGLFAGVYWKKLSGIAVSFGNRQSVPEHWRTFGERQSPLSDNARRAVTPANAALNYIYRVAVAEVTIALHACGLDPALGVLHDDKDDRASLTYDLLEPLRPCIDHYFFNWLREATFSKRDFVEGVRGEIHITQPLSTHLAMTAALWRHPAESLVGWFYKCLERGKVAPLRIEDVSARIKTAGAYARRWQSSTLAARQRLRSPIPRTCIECGKVLQARRRKFCSDPCAAAYYGVPEGTPYPALVIARERSLQSRRKA